MRWKVIGLVLAVPVIVYVVFAMIYGRLGLLEKAFGPIRRDAVNFATLDLMPSPNQYLVCPPDLCKAKPHAENPVYNASLTDLRAAWQRMIERQPRVTLLSSDANIDQYEYQALTPILHFPDAVTVRLLPANEGRTTLAIYSRSHYGHGDLGENKRRIEGWLQDLSKELGKP